jgi:hypothetical protein
MFHYYIPESLLFEVEYFKIEILISTSMILNLAMKEKKEKITNSQKYQNLILAFLHVLCQISLLFRLSIIIFKDKTIRSQMLNDQNYPFSYLIVSKFFRFCFVIGV